MSAEAKPERDPKVDPKRGDVLRWEWLSYGDTFVTEVIGQTVWIARNGLRVSSKQSLRTFRRWAAGATVIRTSEGKGE